MVGQFLRGGIRAVPAGLQLSEAADAQPGHGRHSRIPRRIARYRHRMPRVPSRASWTQRAQATRSACGRRLAGEVRISGGDGLQMSAADLLRHLSGARWRKLIGSGYAVVAAIERAGQRSVFFAEVGSEPVAITGIQLFRDAG